ncbi:sec1 family domain-containing protein 2-like [Ascaphus truei]|uniref:sec1 family domain-containing protein 2-like n=1 Tax=Ascaphus truei TaxID=8439 RepID=UPI003F591930
MKLALEEWRHLLEGAETPITIVTDHKNLLYIEGARRLGARQARWPLFFSRFNFVISYLPGTKNVKADALSHQFLLEDNSEDQLKTILPSKLILSSTNFEALMDIVLQQNQIPDNLLVLEGRLFTSPSLRKQVLEWGHSSKLDAPPCAEILHWCGGAELLLLSAGALHVKEFSSFEAGAANQPKALFVVCCPLWGRALDVVSQSSFQYCVLVTAVSPGEAEGQGGHQQLEDRLCEWMGNMIFTAEVTWAPLLLAPISPHLFLAPAFSLFPLLPGRDLQALNHSRPDKKRIPGLGDVELPSLPPELQLHIRSLVSGLNHLMEGIGLREECFSVGHLSRIIAGELASYPQEAYTD